MGAKKLTYNNKTNHYYPYGMLLPNRHEDAGEYRYGFQGQEKDDEIKGEGNSLNYTFRMHDPRVGRFFATDPLESTYPFYSPYVFSGNQVIQFVELEGLETGESGAISGIKKLSAIPQGPSTRIGYIFTVDGANTSSGKPYVGRTTQGSPAQRGKYSTDGRNRTNATINGIYDASKSGQGAYQEQTQINKNDGIKNLDNKINAQNETRYNAMSKNAATTSGTATKPAATTTSSKPASTTTNASSTTGTTQTKGTTKPVSTTTPTSSTKPKLATIKAPVLASKVAGPLMVGYGLYTSGTAIVESETPVQQTGKEVVKWGGAYMGVEIGGAIGACGGPIAPITIPLGMLIGGAIGWWSGATAVGD